MRTDFDLGAIVYDLPGYTCLLSSKFLVYTLSQNDSYQPSSIGSCMLLLALLSSNKIVNSNTGRDRGQRLGS